MMAAFAIVLAVVAVNAALIVGFWVRVGFVRQEGGYYPVSRFADSFGRREDGTVAPAEEEDWQAHFDWAMLLDDSGRILWSHALLAGFVPLLLLDAGLILLIYLMLGWFGAKPLRALAEGIDRLAKGDPVQLQQKGATGELAKKLNEAGIHLQKQARLIAQRDAARTSWIAGVSHDLRTPLALIMGYAEQMEAAARPDTEQRSRAAAIRAQSVKIKTLIEDLNLTSKLQYDAQPLRLREVQIGPWLRDRRHGRCEGKPASAARTGSWRRVPGNGAPPACCG